MQEVLPEQLLLGLRVSPLINLQSERFIFTTNFHFLHPLITIDPRWTSESLNFWCAIAPLLYHLPFTISCSAMVDSISQIQSGAGERKGEKDTLRAEQLKAHSSKRTRMQMGCIALSRFSILLFVRPVPDCLFRSHLMRRQEQQQVQQHLVSSSVDLLLTLPFFPNFVSIDASAWYNPLAHPSTIDLAALSASAAQTARAP